jgi:hypothetical protein
MRLCAYDGRWAVCRLDAAAGVPDWVSFDGPFAAVVRRGAELSVVCAAGDVPDGVVAEHGWVALEIEGPMEFTLTGVLASVAQPLAGAGVPIFALATYDTDVVLVPAARLEPAVAALRSAGHEVVV